MKHMMFLVRNIQRRSTNQPFRASFSALESQEQVHSTTNLVPNIHHLVYHDEDLPLSRWSGRFCLCHGHLSQPKRSHDHEQQPTFCSHPSQVEQSANPKCQGFPPDIDASAQ